MGITEFTFKLLLLFFPGLVAFMIIDKLTIHKETKTLWVILYAFVYGIISYLIYYFLKSIIEAIYFYKLFKCFNIYFDMKFLESLKNSQIIIDFIDIGYTTIVAMVLSFILSALYNYRIFYKIFNFFMISSNIGDVWTYALEDNDWVVIRDIDRDRMYQGILVAFSESWSSTEIYLINVDIYTNKKAEFVRHLPGLLLTRNKAELIFEFPKDKLFSKIQMEVSENGRKRKKVSRNQQ
jgi:hypothetical protein